MVTILTPLIEVWPIIESCNKVVYLAATYGYLQIAPRKTAFCGFEL
jgi:hypothetical protein